jgi:pimeloyl-ACP methyl ester carboxylesterase
MGSILSRNEPSDKPGTIHGRHDQLTSTRFADRLKSGIRNSELVIFEQCAHAPLYENVAAFNPKTLAFLQRHAGAAVA